MSVIANTTVISNFASIGQLDLLRRLFGAVHISTEVHQEILAGLHEGYRFYQDIDRHIYPRSAEGWLRLTSPNEEEIAILSTLPAHLHEGEASCIAIARNRGWWFLSDDLAARTMALEYAIHLSGSVGCLVLIVEKSLATLDQTNGLLHEMIRHGYRSPVTDLTPLLGHR